MFLETLIYGVFQHLMVHLNSGQSLLFGFLVLSLAEQSYLPAFTTSLGTEKGPSLGLLDKADRLWQLRERNQISVGKELEDGEQELEEWEEARAFKRATGERGGRREAGGPRRPEPSKAPPLEAQATLPINSLKAFLSASESWSGFIDKNRYCFRAECVNESWPWTPSTCLGP